MRNSSYSVSVDVMKLPEYQSAIAPHKANRPVSICEPSAELRECEARAMLTEALDDMGASKRQAIKARQMLRERMSEYSYLDEDTIFAIVYDVTAEFRCAAQGTESTRDDDSIGDDGALIDTSEILYNRLYPPCTDSL